MTPDLGRYWTEEDNPLEAPNASRPHIANNGEGAHAVDPLPRRWDDQGWDDPGAGRHRPGRRPSYHQTPADQRSPRRDDGKSHWSKVEASHELSGQDRRGGRPSKGTTLRKHCLKK